MLAKPSFFELKRPANIKKEIANTETLLYTVTSEFESRLTLVKKASR